MHTRAAVARMAGAGDGAGGGRGGVMQGGAKQSLRVAVLTAGTRGDVQPFVALGRYMQNRGHQVMICTSDDFQPFVESAWPVATRG